MSYLNSGNPGSRRTSAGPSNEPSPENKPYLNQSGSGSASGRTPTSMELAAEAEAKRRKVQRACDVCRRYVWSGVTIGYPAGDESATHRAPAIAIIVVVVVVV